MDSSVRRAADARGRGDGDGYGGDSGTVELAHFWAEGDGARMLAAVLDEFARRHSAVDVRDISYDNHGLAIKSRILREDPPSVFVEWPDRNLEPYVRAGALRALDDLWAANDWAGAFVEGARESVRVDGQFVGVPVDIHRMNNVFYDVELAEAVGVDPGGADDPREFLELLEQCRDQGVVGMEQPMKNPSTVLQLFANAFIGQFGAEAFDELTRERPAAHRDEVAEVLDLLDAYAALASDDASFLDMVDANERFLAGESVCFHQGDWMAGEYADVEGFDYGSDGGWDRVDFPGTEGVYMMGVDAVVAAEGAVFDDASHTFLEFLGSPGALETLNRVKGSIPPRRDVSMDSYPPFLREQYDDFQAASHFPAGHALQVTPEAFVEVKAAMSEFIAHRDVERTARALVEGYRAGLAD